MGSREHKDVADKGSDGTVYAKAGMALEHGDLTMLRGDYFEEEVLLKFWNTPSQSPGRQPASQDEIIAAIKEATGGRDRRFQPGGAWHAIDIDPAIAKLVTERYQRLAVDNTDHFTHNEKKEKTSEGYELGSAPGTYVEAHKRAIEIAFKAGKAGRPIDDAMIVEAMGEHFLTDSFSAGHATTPRGAIKEYWNAKYPSFGEQFVAKMTRDMTTVLQEQATKLSEAIPENFIEDNVRSKIKKQIGAIPLPTFGEIISLVAHDYDNAHEGGIRMTNDLGWHWTAYGDGHLDKPTAGEKHTVRGVMTQAVRQGCNDVRNAYALGRSMEAVPFATYDAQSVQNAVRAQAAAPATPGAKFAPEQYIPRLDDGQEPLTSWRGRSILDIWETRVRPGQEASYGELISKSARSGDIHDTLASSGKSQDEKINPYDMPWYGKGAMFGISPLVGLLVETAHGYLYPRRAFMEAVVEAIADNPLHYILDIVGEGA